MSNKPELTRWFNPSEKPARHGNYECKTCGQLHKWLGGVWLWGHGQTEPCHVKSVTWRGLKEPA
jgi:hypothetical protein